MISNLVFFIILITCVTCVLEILIFINHIAQSAGGEAVEYTDCTSSEG